MGIASPNLSFQNWYSDSLAASCGSTDNTLTINNLPVPTEGFLIIDPNNTDSREVVHYTGQTSTTVTGVTRGLDGTSPAEHDQNTTVIMNITSSHFEALQDGSALLAGAILPNDLMSETGTTWVWQSWTPTWGGLTVGNGTVAAAYIQHGKTVFYRLTLTCGSSTTLGTSVDTTFTLPVAPNVAYPASMSIGQVTWDGGGLYQGILLASASSSTTATVNLLTTVSESIGTRALDSNNYGVESGYALYVQGCYQST